MKEYIINCILDEDGLVSRDLIKETFVSKDKKVTKKALKERIDLTRECLLDLLNTLQNIADNFPGNIDEYTDYLTDFNFKNVDEQVYETKMKYNYLENDELHNIYLCSNSLNLLIKNGKIINHLYNNMYHEYEFGNGVRKKVLKELDDLLYKINDLLIQIDPDKNDDLYREENSIRFLIIKKIKELDRKRAKEESEPHKEKGASLLEVLQGVSAGIKDLHREFSGNTKPNDDDTWYLTEEEKELVKSGEYEPENFDYPEDTDDLDEEDYYGEDY
jgi:hypothetical protein